MASLGRSLPTTIDAMDVIREHLPFPLLGVDFDSGGEFVNVHFLKYAKERKITCTRSREGKKNDHAYIEQANFSVVRRFVGYRRLSTVRECEVLNELYRYLSDYQNFFQPMMKLKEKKRDGARVTRYYDQAKTAYQRILEYESIDSTIKGCLRKRYLRLNPAYLIRKITQLGQKLSY